MKEFLVIFGPILLAAALGGGSAGVVGVFTLGLRMPFLAVCMAHAAMAGAVFAGLFGLPMSLGGFVGALFGTALLLLFCAGTRLGAGGVVGLVFSVMLGLAFLGIGMQTGPKEGALDLMWGSLLFVGYRDLWMLGLVCVLLLVFTVGWRRELKLLLFSRPLAASLIREGALLAVLLLLASAVITVNLERVGGLLLYSLVCNPALAAMRIARGFTSCLVWSGLLGAASAIAGFLAAYFLDLPVGACIVLASSLAVALSYLAGWKAHGSH